MRDQRYGSILIVRIECGGAAAAAVAAASAAASTSVLLPREPTATGLHRSFDAICAIYDTGPWT